MQCKQCGETVTKDMLFCGNCGCPISQESNTHVDMHCPNCGNVIKDGDAFCGECGYKIEAIAETVSPDSSEIKTEPIRTDSKIEDEEVNMRIDRDDGLVDKEDAILKSTLLPRENSEDLSLYSEGKKFLRTAGEIE